MAGRPKRRARLAALAAASKALKPTASDPKSPGTWNGDERRPEDQWEDAPSHKPQGDDILESALVSLMGGPAEEATAADPGQGVRDGDEILNSQAQFNKIYRLAMEDAIYILELKPKPGDPDFSKILTRKSTIISAVMSAAVRVDEARVRGIRKSQVDRVLDAIREAEKKIPA